VRRGDVSERNAACACLRIFSGYAVARHRFLRNAPIREAIVDIKVSPPIGLESLDPVFESLKATFPQQESMQQSTFGFELGPKVMRTARMEGSIQGRRLTSDDGKHIVQFRVDGFTFSRLPPYETWETLRERAEPLWTLYQQKAKAEKITRAAVRYINVMSLPMPITDFKEYLSAPPSLPNALPQEMGGFFSRVIVIHREIDAAAFVTQALESSLDNKVQVILDIDVFQESKSTDWLANDAQTWNKLEQMRDFKNRIFFESITEKTAGLFE
jgi:uncharacterized protein (TIGR04255 family)